MEERRDNAGLICAWCVPRARSTAFYRHMKERGDHVVLYGPFSRLHLFGKVTVGDSVAYDDTELITALRKLSEDRRVFFQDAGIRHIGDDRVGRIAHLLRDAVHTCLIRDPRDVLASQYDRAKKVGRPLGRVDVGFERLAFIHDALEAAAGRPPVVLNSDDLVRDPAGVMRAYCSAVRIPFLAEALTWRPDPLPEVFETLRDSQTSSMGSTGFAEPAAGHPDTTANTPMLAEYLEHHLPYYRRLNDRRVRAG